MGIELKVKHTIQDYGVFKIDLIENHENCEEKEANIIDQKF